MNYLSVGFGFRATTGRNSMCWQVGGETLEGHWKWGKGIRYKGQTAAIQRSWERWVLRLCRELQCVFLPDIWAEQKPPCSAAVYESGRLWGQLTHTHTHWSQCGDTSTSAVYLRRGNTYWLWVRCPWGTVPLRKPGHRFSEIHNLKWEKKKKIVLAGVTWMFYNRKTPWIQCHLWGI